MAEKILSQDEVDTLLKGVKEGKVDTQTLAPSSDAQPYDLANEERIMSARMPTLEFINERLARFFQSSLSAILRETVEVTPEPIEVCKFEVFIGRFSLPISINLIKMEPLKGHVLLVIDAQMVYLLLDRFFGGKGQTDVKTEGKEFTAIDLKFIQKIVNAMLEDLQKAWESTQPIRVSFVRAETDPQYAMVVGPSELVVVIVFKLQIGGQERNAFLCLPYPTIEPIRAKLCGGLQNDQREVDNQWTDRYKAQLEGSRLSVTAELGAAFLSVQEVMNLKVGDVIVLDKGVNDDLTLKVEGRPKLFGKPGMSRGNLAFQITSLIRNKETAHGE